MVGGNFGSEFQWHLDPNCKVTAVCDLREDRLKHLVEVYGPATKYKDFRQFLKHPELDAVAVFTPAPLHVWMATEAMKAGKHAISAVPAGMSVEELELLLETVKKTGMKYMMAETSYYRPQVITCREWARQGKVRHHLLHRGGISSRRLDSQSCSMSADFPPGGTVSAHALPHPLHGHRGSDHRRAAGGSRGHRLGRRARGAGYERIRKSFLEHNRLLQDLRRAQFPRFQCSGMSPQAGRNGEASMEA